MKLVGRVQKSAVDGGAFVRIDYPPFDVLVARIDGGYTAIEDACNHSGASLCPGNRLLGDRVVCPMHGYVFSLRTGELLAPRGLCGAQRTFVVEEQGDEIAVFDTFTVKLS